jgi:hypothetical protein
MGGIWRGAVVAAVLVGVGAQPAAAARTVDCAPARASSVVNLVATGVGCREARRVASAHERSYRRRGACRSAERRCTIRPFQCGQSQMDGQPVAVVCSTPRKQQVKFGYRGAAPKPAA